MTPAVVIAIVVVALLLAALLVAGLRRRSDDAPLEGNDPARPGAPTSADGRGAVNRSSWMLGGGGGGGGG